MATHSTTPNTIRILIADDEAPARRELRRLLLTSPDTYISGEAENGLEVLEQLKKTPVDVLFLDIQMPGMDGIKTAEQVRALYPECIIVFVTAFTDYAVQAFEVHAVDYLMKPVRQARLHETLERIRRRRTQPAEMFQYAAQFAKLFSSFETPEPEARQKEQPRKERISVYQGDSIIPIAVSDIIYAESQGRYASITTNRGTFATQLAFYELENILTPPRFFTTHRSFIVCIDKIESIELWINNTYRLKVMGSDASIPVSRSKIPDFKKIMNL